MPRVAENTSQSVENPWASVAPRPLVTTSHWPLVLRTYGARRPFSVLAPVKFRPVSAPVRAWPSAQEAVSSDKTVPSTERRCTPPETRTDRGGVCGTVGGSQGVHMPPSCCNEYSKYGLAPLKFSEYDTIKVLP